MNEKTVAETAMITGACGGIGFATVQYLAARGCSVLAMDLIPEDAAAEKLKPLGTAVTYFRGDLGAAADRAAALDAARARFGVPRILVNVAGVAPRVRRDLLEMTEESYDFVMGVNTKGTMFLTQAVAKAMLEAEPIDGIRGFIVNISSMSAYTSSVSRGEYCISKAGVSMVTKLFADRLAGEGILVNEIRPGIIATGMTATVKEKYDRLIGDGLLPIARWGQPEDIARAVGVLTDGSLGYTTGQSIDVDGGFHIRSL